MNINIYRFAGIFSLIALAVAQPIFDQYSKNINFFVAWDISGVELFLIVLAAYALVPALIIGVVIAAYRISHRLGFAIEVFVVNILICVFFMQILKQIELHGLWVIYFAILLSIIAAATYFRYKLVRKYLAYFSIATVTFPLFFIQSIYSSGYFDVAGNDRQSNDVISDIPVVLIVYDELPLTTLLNSSGLIDEERFPEISRLANDSVWYVNAETKSGETNIAVPSIISGIKKDHGTPPKFTSYPNNLFTLLGGSHSLNVIESMTELCPPEFKCRERIATKVKVPGILYDTFLIFSHITLPAAITSRFPPINFKTHDFGYTLEKTEDSVVKEHNRFLSMIEESASGKPSLFFIHNVIPHVPWVYQPSGRRYTNSKSSELPGLSLAEERWHDNEWLVIQAYQRHILQTMYVDRMVGEIMGELKDDGLYEKSLIIFTADHGVSFWPNQSRRGVLKNPESDILNIPLLVKYPNDLLKGGVISSDKASSIDILPTIADVLNIDVPFEVNGSSLLQNKTMPFEAVSLSENKYIASVSLQKKLNLFGEGDVNLIYKIGEHDSLIGKRISGGEHPSGLMRKLFLDDVAIFQDVNKNGPFIPSQIKGRISTSGDKNPNYYLAVAVNNVVCGVTETYPENGDLLFSSLVPEDCFLPGKNDIKIFEVSESGAEVLLAFTENGEGGPFGVYKSGTITLNSGEVLNKSKMDGNIDVFSYDEKTRLLYVAGWAADIGNGRIANNIFYRIGDVVYPISSFRLKRVDVAEAFKNKELTNSGFEFYLPVKELSGRELDIIAVNDDGKFGNLSTAKFAEKMSKKELKMLGLYRHSDGARFKHFFRKLFSNTERKTESIGEYSVKGVVLGSGDSLRESETSLQGHVDIFSFDKSTQLVDVAGWAANTAKGEPAKYILYRIDNEVFYGSPVSLNRPDVATAFQRSSLSITGFRFNIPSTLISEKSIVEIISVMPNGEYKRIPTDKFADIILKINK